VKRLLIGIAAALVLGVAPVVAAHPAALASPIHICTESGNHYCVGASSLTDGTIITNSGDGRDMILGLVTTIGGRGVYQLIFAADHAKCVGLSASGLAEVRSCNDNGSNFTNWVELIQPDGLSVRWSNQTFSASNCDRPGDQGNYLTSNNKQGDRLYCSSGAKSGDLRSWTL
jgi:hypothetical protein